MNSETAEYVAISVAPVCVNWAISTNKDMSGTPAAKGQAYTSSDIDYTVKVGTHHRII